MKLSIAILLVLFIVPAAFAGETDVNSIYELTMPVLDQQGTQVDELKVVAKDRLQGVLFSFTSSSIGFLGLHFVAGEDLQTSAIVAASMLTIALFHNALTERWQKYLQKGLYLKNALSLIRKDLFTNPIVVSSGNILAAAAFNIIPTSFILYMTGEFNSMAMAALLGVIGAYDYTIDIVAGKLQRRGYLSVEKMKKIMRYRTLAGPVMEMFSLSGYSLAQYLMSGIGVTGMMAIFRGEKLVEDLSRAKRKLDILALVKRLTEPKCGKFLKTRFFYPSYEDTW